MPKIKHAMMIDVYKERKQVSTEKLILIRK